MGIRVFQAEMNSNCLKAQGSMMSAVACASVPKITVVIGGCYGMDSYAMVTSVTHLYITYKDVSIIRFSGFLQCGRAFEPNFLFLWPNARVSVVAPGHASSLLPLDSQQEEDLNRRLTEESSAFFSSGRLWDDGVILPHHTRKVDQDASKGSGSFRLVGSHSVIPLAGSCRLPRHHRSAAQSDLHKESASGTLAYLRASVFILWKSRDISQTQANS